MRSRPCPAWSMPSSLKVRPTFAATCPALRSSLTPRGPPSPPAVSCAVTWDEGKFGEPELDRVHHPGQGTGRGRGPLVAQGRDPDAALNGAVKVVEAQYAYPFISHATLEPMNCTAEVKGDKVEVWAPTQNPASGQTLISEVLGVPKENITVHMIRGVAASADA